MIYNESLNQISPYIILLFVSFLTLQLTHYKSINSYRIPILCFLYIILSYSCYFYTIFPNIERYTVIFVITINLFNMWFAIDNRYIPMVVFVFIFMFYCFVDNDAQLFYISKTIFSIGFIHKIPLIYEDFTNKEDKFQMQWKPIAVKNNSQDAPMEQMLKEKLKHNENTINVLTSKLEQYKEKCQSFEIKLKENMKLKNKWMKSKNISKGLRKEIKSLKNKSSQLQRTKEKLIAENQSCHKQFKNVNHKLLEFENANQILLRENDDLKRENVYESKFQHSSIWTYCDCRGLEFGLLALINRTELIELIGLVKPRHIQELRSYKMSQSTSGIGLRVMNF